MGAPSAASACGRCAGPAITQAANPAASQLHNRSCAFICIFVIPPSMDVHAIVVGARFRHARRPRGVITIGLQR